MRNKITKENKKSGGTKIKKKVTKVKRPTAAKKVIVKKTDRNKIQTRRFERRKEDFKCEYCGEKVLGNGYTNHCPQCLWSKHVDTNPGDRSEKCRGLMEPVGIETKGGEHVILHRCAKCKNEKRNKMGEKDSFEAVISVAKRAGGISIG